MTGLARAEAPADGPASQSAAEKPPAEADQAPKGLLDRDTLTGQWFGLGERLADDGLSVCLTLTQVGQQNLRGGLSTQRRAGRYSGRYDLDVEADLEKLLHLPGGRVYAQGRGGWSDGIDPSSVGSLFGVNGVPMGDEPVVLWQLFYEQKMLNDRVVVRVGKMDLTDCLECHGSPSCFDGNTFANDELTQFLNGSLINNPTIPFPEPGLGALVHVEPMEGWYVAAAVADANAEANETGFNTTFHGPSDFFSIYETGIMPKLPSARGDLQGGYRAGLWFDPQRKERLDGEGFERDDKGFYASADQMVWKENEDKDDTQGLGLFARYGLADADVSEIKSFWSIGAQYQGLLPSRDEDVLGFGVGQGRLSRQGDFTQSNETALELYYRIQVTPWLHISPDVQYIFHPGGEDAGNAVVIGLRVGICW